MYALASSLARAYKLHVNFSSSVGTLAPPPNTKKLATLLVAERGSGGGGGWENFDTFLLPQKKLSQFPQTPGIEAWYPRT